MFLIFLWLHLLIAIADSSQVRPRLVVSPLSAQHTASTRAIQSPWNSSAIAQNTTKTNLASNTVLYTTSGASQSSGTNGASSHPGTFPNANDITASDQFSPSRSSKLLGGTNSQYSRGTTALNAKSSAEADLQTNRNITSVYGTRPDNQAVKGIDGSLSTESASLTSVTTQILLSNTTSSTLKASAEGYSQGNSSLSLYSGSHPISRLPTEAIRSALNISTLVSRTTKQYLPSNPPLLAPGFSGVTGARGSSGVPFFTGNHASGYVAPKVTHATWNASTLLPNPTHRSSPSMALIEGNSSRNNTSATLPAGSRLGSAGATGVTRSQWKSSAILPLLSTGTYHLSLNGSALPPKASIGSTRLSRNSSAPLRNATGQFFPNSTALPKASIGSTRLSRNSSAPLRNATGQFLPNSTALLKTKSNTLNSSRISNSVS